MARPKLPAEIKERKGTLRKSRINTNQPKLNKDIPVAPDDLSPLAKSYFKKVCQLMDGHGTITLSDVFAVATLAQIMEREFLCNKEMQELGALSQITPTKVGSPMVRMYPHMTALNDLARVKATYLAKCGLTAADRQSLTVSPKDEVTTLQTDLDSLYK